MDLHLSQLHWTVPVERLDGNRSKMHWYSKLQRDGTDQPTPWHHHRDDVCGVPLALQMFASMNARRPIEPTMPVAHLIAVLRLLPGSSTSLKDSGH